MALSLQEEERLNISCLFLGESHVTHRLFSEFSHRCCVKFRSVRCTAERGVNKLVKSEFWLKFQLQELSLCLILVIPVAAVTEMMQILTPGSHFGHHTKDVTVFLRDGISSLDRMTLNEALSTPFAVSPRSCWPDCCCIFEGKSRTVRIFQASCDLSVVCWVCWRGQSVCSIHTPLFRCHYTERTAHRLSPPSLAGLFDQIWGRKPSI